MSQNTMDRRHFLRALGTAGAAAAISTAGAGIAFLYYPVVRAELASGALREIPLPGGPITHDFTFLWRKGSVFAPYYRKIFRQLQLDASPALPENSLWENDCNSRSPVLK